jgi:hypothetical protein
VNEFFDGRRRRGEVGKIELELTMKGIFEYGF